MSGAPPDEIPRNQILIGDARERLKELPAGAVDCVVTSPPYFGLRDYGMSAQLGLEPNIDAWVASLLEVCRELARILKPTGSLWLNVGDGYSAHPREGAAVKSLLLGPERLATALARDGWILRNRIVWHKPNAMPQSVGDRLSNRHETMLFLTRSRRYFFDLDAIREPVVTVGTRRPNRAPYPPPSAAPFVGKVPRIDLNLGLRQFTAGSGSHPLGKNPGDVWMVATAGFRGAHFATFPFRLIERPLLATCPQQVCTSCGRPWIRTPAGREHAAKLGAVKPGCACRADTRPGLVLDPFFGSGTVALAAEAHGRDWLGIELNPAYVALSQRRLASQRTAHPTTSSAAWADRPPPGETAA